MSLLRTSEDSGDFPAVADLTTADLAFASRPPAPNAGTEVAARVPLHRMARLDRVCRAVVLRRLAGLSSGTLEICDDDGTHRVGIDCGANSVPSITVRDSRFYSRTVFGGSLGAAESFLEGEWDCEDLVGVMRLLGRENAETSKLERGFADLFRPARATWNWLRRNTRGGSRRNIAAHYDLSNEFFQLMLDPTMTYSAGIFETPEASLEDASRAKYDRLCRKLCLRPEDHVMEIGTGWGGFALHAAGNYGCRVTTTTISQQQFTLAQQRVRKQGLSERITVLLQDYRDLSGSYDKLVSIEMIEAVGHRFLDKYFAQCCKLLKPDGMMALQAIIIPDERYDEYRKNVDFIQRYIFPGGCLPSFSAIGGALKRGTDFRLVHSEDFAEHYAETLSRWRLNFWSQADSVRKLGFDERFMRMWNYYLCYCEAGFRERQIGVSQVLLTRPDSRSSLVGAV